MEGSHTGRRAANCDARVNSPLETLARPLRALDAHRHSYADHARRMSGDLYAISKSPGHSHLQTTETHLNSFDRVAVDQLARDVWNG